MCLHSTVISQVKDISDFNFNCNNYYYFAYPIEQISKNMRGERPIFFYTLNFSAYLFFIDDLSKKIKMRQFFVCSNVILKLFLLKRKHESINVVLLSFFICYNR